MLYSHKSINLSLLKQIINDHTMMQMFDLMNDTYVLNSNFKFV